MTREITPDRAIKLASFFKSARANQPHRQPTGRIITDLEEIAKRTPPGFLSEVVIRIDRSQNNSDVQREN